MFTRMQRRRLGGGEGEEGEKEIMQEKIGHSA